MTELILVRHGQANSGARTPQSRPGHGGQPDDPVGASYDELTELGHAQARKIGQWLKSAGYEFDYFVHGGLKRQRETLENIGEELAGGKSIPGPEIYPAFAEFDLKVFGILAAEMRHGRPDFAAVLKEWNKVRKENSPDKGVVFKKLMALVLSEWVARGEAFTEAENFPAFQKKVLSALEIPVTKPGRYLAVTSGGPISMLTGHVLGLGLTQTLGLMRRIYNTSLHHFVLRDNKWELASFNTVPHLKATERTLV